MSETWNEFSKIDRFRVRSEQAQKATKNPAFFNADVAILVGMDKKIEIAQKKRAALAKKIQETCPHKTEGHNDYEKDTCPRCGGSGYMDKDKVKSVTIKKTVVTENRVEISVKDLIDALRELNYPIPEEAVLVADRGVEKSVTFWWKTSVET